MTGLGLVLKVDWQTLPQLKFLQIDLRLCSWHGTRGLEEERRKLMDGARRMKRLKLRTLVSVGSCSRQCCGDPGHERKIKRLFTPAVGGGRKMEFLDRQYAPLW